jgi:hypothetical protein
MVLIDLKMTDRLQIEALLARDCTIILRIMQQAGVPGFAALVDGRPPPLACWTELRSNA